MLDYQLIPLNYWGIAKEECGVWRMHKEAPEKCPHGWFSEAAVDMEDDLDFPDVNWDESAFARETIKIICDVHKSVDDKSDNNIPHHVMRILNNKNINVTGWIIESKGNNFDIRIYANV